MVPHGVSQVTYSGTEVYVGKTTIDIIHNEAINKGSSGNHEGMVVIIAASMTS